MTRLLCDYCCIVRVSVVVVLDLDIIFHLALLALPLILRLVLFHFISSHRITSHRIRSCYVGCRRVFLLVSRQYYSAAFHSPRAADT